MAETNHLAGRLSYPFQHMEDFRAAERSARQGRLGLWAPVAEPGVAGSKPEAHDSGDATVYVTRTGAKYHRADCRSLARSTGATPIPLDRAVARYLPCKVCDPPSSEHSPATQQTGARR